MAKIQKYYQRGRHPKGFWGKRALKAMNGKEHSALPEWTIDKLDLSKNSRILDVGCGGGANVKRLLKLCPEGRVTGLDHSQLAIDLTTELNYPAIKDGYCVIVGGNAIQMPLAREIFDVVTAFETIYFWPSLDSGLAEIHRVLKPGGMAVIANELDGLNPGDDELARAVGGMRVYTPDEIKQSLTGAGFNAINVHQDESRHYICITAEKA